MFLIGVSLLLLVFKMLMAGVLEGGCDHLDWRVCSTTGSVALAGGYRYMKVDLTLFFEIEAK